MLESFEISEKAGIKSDTGRFQKKAVANPAMSMASTWPPAIV